MYPIQALHLDRVANFTTAIVNAARSRIPRGQLQLPAAAAPFARIEPNLINTSSFMSDRFLSLDNVRARWPWPSGTGMPALTGRSLISYGVVNGAGRGGGMKYEERGTVPVRLSEYALPFELKGAKIP